MLTQNQKRVRDEVCTRALGHEWNVMVVGLSDWETCEVMTSVMTKLCADQLNVVEIDCRTAFLEDGSVCQFQLEVEKKRKKCPSSQYLFVIARNFDEVVHLDAKSLDLFTQAITKWLENSKIVTIMESRYPTKCLLAKAREHIRGQTAFEGRCYEHFLPLNVDERRYIGVPEKRISNIKQILIKAILPLEEREDGLLTMYDVLCRVTEGKRLVQEVYRPLIDYGLMTDRKEILVNGIVLMRESVNSTAGLRTLMVDLKGRKVWFLDSDLKTTFEKIGEFVTLVFSLLHSEMSCSPKILKNRLCDIFSAIEQHKKIGPIDWTITSFEYNINSLLAAIRNKLREIGCDPSCRVVIVGPNKKERAPALPSNWHEYFKVRWILDGEQDDFPFEFFSKEVWAKFKDPIRM